MAYHRGITSQLKATGLKVVHSSHLQKLFQHTEIQPLVERKSDVILKNKVLQNKFTQRCVISNSRPMYMVVLASAVEGSFDVRRAQCN